MQINRLIKQLLFKLVKPSIIFESYPDFTDNTKAVFDEMIARNYNRKYYLFWYINNSEYAIINKSGNIEYWERWDNKSLKNKIRSLSLRKKVKAVIMCNRFITPTPFSKCDVSIYLTHGTPIKNTKNYYNIPACVDFCLASSTQAKALVAESFNYDIKKVIPLGLPRNDVFTKPVIDIKKLLNTTCSKIIVWYPTYKQHNSGMKTGSDKAIPIIYNKNSRLKLNNELQKRNIMIVIKPHFAQDLSFICKQDLSNMKFIDDKFYEAKGITSYQFLAASDALLTDYSSVYCDYLLCDKPIGLIWEDIEDYKLNPGLHPKYKELSIGTYKIYTLDDLLCFVNNLGNDVDPLKHERQNLRDILNKSIDGKNSIRVVDFIENCLNSNS